MRHNKKFNHLGRTASHRNAMLANMAMFAVTELFKVISEKVANRPGGYTRIIKLGTRQGDAAEICFIELVDFDENMAKTPKAAKKTRRSRKAAPKAEAPVAAAEEAPKAEEAPVAEAPAAEEAKAEEAKAE